MQGEGPGKEETPRVCTRLAGRTHFDHIKDKLTFSPSVLVPGRGAALKMCVVSFDAPTGCLRRKVARGVGRSRRASRSSRRPRPCGLDRGRPDLTQPPRGLFSVPLTYRVPRRPTGNCAPLLCFKQARTADRNFATLRHDTMSSSRAVAQFGTRSGSTFSLLSHCVCLLPCPALSQEEEQKEKTWNREQE